MGFGASFAFLPLFAATSVTLGRRHQRGCTMPDDLSSAKNFGVSTGPLPASTKIHIPGVRHP
jgi:hypothetical protein